METVWTILVLILIAAYVIFAFKMRSLAISGDAVLYAGWMDVAASVLLPIVLLILAAIFGNQGAFGQWIAYLILAIALIWFFAYNIKQAARLNSSNSMATTVAIFRIIFALSWILAVLAALNLLNPNTTKDGVTVSKGAIAWAIGIAITYGIYKFFAGFITDPDLIPSTSQG